MRTNWDIIQSIFTVISFCLATYLTLSQIFKNRKWRISATIVNSNFQEKTGIIINNGLDRLISLEYIQIKYRKRDKKTKYWKEWRDIDIGLTDDIIIIPIEPNRSFFYEFFGIFKDNIEDILIPGSEICILLSFYNFKKERRCKIKI